MIEFGKANVQAVSAYDRTPLHIAAEEGNIEVAKILLENNANVNAEGMGKLTAFHLACMQGNCDMAMLLVNHGADVNLKNEEKNGLKMLFLVLLVMLDLKRERLILMLRLK